MQFGRKWPLGHFRPNCFIDPKLSVHKRVLRPVKHQITPFDCSNTPTLKGFSSTSGLVPSSPVSVNCPFRANVQNFKMRFLGSTRSKLNRFFTFIYLRKPEHLFIAYLGSSSSRVMCKTGEELKMGLFRQRYFIDPKFSLHKRVLRPVKHQSTRFNC